MENKKPKVSKKQQGCVNRYIAAAYDRINLTIPKGQRDVIKAHAESLGESVNGYIWRIIREDMAKNKDG